MKYIIAALIFLGACAPRPSMVEVHNADYGTYPDDHEQIIKNFYAGIMKDPYSVQYIHISQPQKRWSSSMFSGVTYGYIVCVTRNAKNSFGAYTGAQTDGLVIRNGVVVKLREGRGKTIGGKTGCN